MDEATLERAVQELPRDAAELIEALLHRLCAVAGDWRFTVFASDGHVRKWTLEQGGGRDELGRFDPPPLRPRGC